MSFSSLLWRFAKVGMSKSSLNLCHQGQTCKRRIATCIVLLYNEHIPFIYNQECPCNTHISLVQQTYILHLQTMANYLRGILATLNLRYPRTPEPTGFS